MKSEKINWIRNNWWQVGLCLILLGGMSVYALLSQQRQSPAINQPAQITKQEDCSVTDKDVIVAINQFRSELGVKPLVFSSDLDSFANQRVIDQNGVLDDHSGLSGAANKLNYQLVGEDQQQWQGCHNSYDRVSNFQSSEKHWQSLMNLKYEQVGVGFYKDVIVIDLGQQRTSSSPATTPAPQSNSELNRKLERNLDQQWYDSNNAVQRYYEKYAN